ncbi:hypothetical protein ACU686_03150 [Yinghuangia aomiensis]
MKAGGPEPGRAISARSSSTRRVRRVARLRAARVTPRSPRPTGPGERGRPRSSQHRFRWFPKEELGSDQLSPPRSASSAEELLRPFQAPTIGQHGAEVLQDLLGYRDDAKIAEPRREAGVLGKG